MRFLKLLKRFTWLKYTLNSCVPHIAVLELIAVGLYVLRKRGTTKINLCCVLKKSIFWSNKGFLPTKYNKHLALNYSVIFVFV
jgi:hypothetical protein